MREKLVERRVYRNVLLVGGTVVEKTVGRKDIL